MKDRDYFKTPVLVMISVLCTIVIGGAVSAGEYSLIMDEMESTSNWSTFVGVVDERWSSADISSVPGKDGKALEISYNLVDDGWVSISKGIDPDTLLEIEGISFDYWGDGNPNTLEFKLVYEDGTNYGKQWHGATSVKDWKTVNVSLMPNENELECWFPKENCEKEGELNLSRVRWMEFAVSDKGIEVGDSGGGGRIIIDNVRRKVPPPLLTGSILASSTPSGAKVYLDGVYKGITPLTISGVSTGFHSLEFRKSGYKTYSENVTVEAGKTVALSSSLESIPVSPLPTKFFVSLAVLAIVAGGLFWVWKRKPTVSTRQISEPFISAQILSCSVASGNFKAGDSVTANVKVENNGNVQHTFYIGYSLQDKNGKWWDAPYVTKTLSPQRSGSVTLSWAIPPDAPSGSYLARVVVWKNAVQGTLHDPLEIKDISNAFVVVVPDPPPFPPKLQARYTDVEYLAKGGFARVFKARRESDDKTVAVKIPISLDEATGRSFLKEIKAWEELKHENIVELYDMNIMPSPYFEMEYVENRSLEEMTKPLKTEKAARIVFDIAEGLKYAHGKGIIHRDLKSGNVLLTKDLTPKITDWGLSKVLAESKTSSLSSFTPLYAAPEQISPKQFGGPPDNRTDIYGLGVIFYELVTGKLPFSGESIAEVSNAIMNEELMKPSEINPEAEEVESIITKCLEKNKEDRYQTAEELQKALADYLKLEYKKSLKESISKGDLTKSRIFCCDLVMLALKLGDLTEVLKYLSILKDNARAEQKAKVENLIELIEMHVKEGVGMNEDLINRIKILIYEVLMG